MDRPSISEFEVEPTLVPSNRISGGFVAVNYPVLSVGHPNGATLIPITSSPFTIGGPQADVPIQSEYVDAWHALIRIVNGVVHVENLQSINGVFLRIENELPLEDFDEIAIGSQRFLFRTSWDPVLTSRIPKAKKFGAPIPRSARLIQILDGGLQGEVWYIREQIVISSLRERILSDNNYAFVEGEDVSLNHAMIRVVNAKYTINDGGSAYGTYVRLGSSVELVDGDTVLIGQTTISIKYP